MINLVKNLTILVSIMGIATSVPGLVRTKKHQSGGFTIADIKDPRKMAPFWCVVGGYSEKQ